MPSTYIYNDDSTQTPKKGTVLYDKKYYYEVLSSPKGKNNGTVKVIGQRRYDIRTIKIASRVKLNGKYYDVTMVDKKAFEGNDRIGKIYIGRNVKTIGKDAFKGCTNLKSVVINSRVLKTIKKNSFANCNKLKKIIIKSKVLNRVYKNAIGKKRITIRVPKGKIAKYRKLIRKSGNKKFKIKRC